jgi:uncharacterized protein (TIGR03435 family)
MAWGWGQMWGRAGALWDNGPAMRNNFWIVAGVASSLLTLAARGQINGSDARVTTPYFDVVAIRESRFSNSEQGMSLRGGFLEVHNLLLKSLITSGYGVREGLIFGLPGWAEEAHYEIRARVTEADPKVLNGSREQRRALMAAMLEDRFQLKLHEATKVLPVYDLVVARDGPKFSESARGDTSDRKSGAEPHVQVSKTEFTGTNASMLMLLSVLEEVVERPVVDKTGLTGAYDLHLKWTPDLTTASDRDTLPSIFTALQEQLGLKLQPNKGPVKTLVVDHVARPSEN